ncbi:MAG: hypothetical protein IPL40_06660 [Proteobacteria bacterium]|nr:hypothetical protein [Pseudomonadota bacterium]
MTRPAEPRPRVLIAEPRDFSAEAVALLRTAAEVELDDSVPLARALADFDVLWLRLAHRLDAEALAAPGRCWLIACPVTGLDHIDLAACAARGIRVLSLRGETAFLRRVRATAEHTLALTLALLRHLPAAHGAVLQGQWDRDRWRGGELYEKTAGLVGLGRLGTIMAGYLRALGMRVLGYDPRDDFPHDAAERVDTLEGLLAQSDLISLHVSYGPETHHLLGAPELALLKPGALLVNTARGGVLDGDALLAALRGGRLAGAALDVLEGEPRIGADHPLVAYARQHDNLLLTPHLGGNTRESFSKTEVFLAQKVIAALQEGQEGSG